MKNIPAKQRTDARQAFMASSENNEQEIKVAKIFAELKDGFKKVNAISDVNKQQNILKDLTGRMQEVKT